MNATRLAMLVLAASLAGCSTAPREARVPDDPPPPAEWAAPDAEPLAQRGRAPSGMELLEYQQFWCARERGARILRRLRLEAPADDLELLLLDYCDEARRSPQRLDARLAALREGGAWPADSLAVLDWMRWHLQAFSAASREAAGRQQQLQHTIDQLRAIESDVNSRDRDAEAQP